jgi:hypothetical protein
VNPVANLKMRRYWAHWPCDLTDKSIAHARHFHIIGARCDVAGDSAAHLTSHLIRWYQHPCQDSAKTVYLNKAIDAALGLASDWTLNERG